MEDEEKIELRHDAFYTERVTNGKRVTLEDIKAHKKTYPTFNDQRMIDWLNQKPYRWNYYDSVLQANQCRAIEAEMIRRYTYDEPFLDNYEWER